MRSWHRSTVRFIGWNVVIVLVVLVWGRGFAAFARTQYAQENAQTFHTAELSNGISVYMKVHPANQVMHIALVLQGGSLVAIPEQAGWEKIALATMARGSSAYPHEIAASILDRTSSSIVNSVQLEYSIFSLTTLGKYRDELVALWSDMLTHPSFDEADFNKAKHDAILALQAMEQDPWSLTQKI